MRELSNLPRASEGCAGRGFRHCVQEPPSAIALAEVEPPSSAARAAGGRHLFGKAS